MVVGGISLPFGGWLLEWLTRALRCCELVHGGEGGWGGGGYVISRARSVKCQYVMGLSDHPTRDRGGGVPVQLIMCNRVIAGYIYFIVRM